MSNTIIPTKSRMVYVKKENEEGFLENNAAVVTAVKKVYVDEEKTIYEEKPSDIKTKPSYLIKACVFRPGRAQSEDEWIKQGQGEGEWDWMEYQKGQAKKTENVEELLAKRVEDLEKQVAGLIKVLSTKPKTAKALEAIEPEPMPESER